jgi:ribosomal protein S24E
MQMNKYKVHIELQFEKRPTNTDVLNKLFDILKNNSIDYIIEKLKTKKGKKND